MQGCSEKRQDDIFAKAKIKTVDSRLYNSEIMMKFCEVMQYNNNCILLTSAGLHRENIVVNAHNGNEIGYLGRTGQGPGEYTYPQFSGFSNNGDTTYIYDIRNGHILVYSTIYSDSIFEKQYIYSIKQSERHVYLYVMRLENGMFVALPYSRKTDELALDLLDSELNVLCQFGNLPLKFKTDYSDFERVFDNCRMAVFKNKVFIALSSFGYIAGYECSNKNQISTLFEETFVAPVFNSQNGYIVFSKTENKFGSYDIAASEDYVCIAYCGKTWSNLTQFGRGLCPELFALFDHSGKLISKVKMNQRGGRVCFSDDGTTLFLCVRDPEYDIASYKVSDLIK